MKTVMGRPADAEIEVRREMPASSKWSLGEATRCGQQGYLRPCQRQDCSAGLDGTYPLASICQSDSELVFVVEDDEALRENLVELVDALGYPAQGCGNASELFTSLHKYKTGCILLDIRLPGQDGVAVQKWMNQSGVVLPIVFISGVQDVATVVHCMKAGAFEFLQKPFGEMALRNAINSAVGQSRKDFCRLQSEAMVQEMVALLTPTELYVAKMISRGYPTKLIAAEMGRSENTVKIHRHRIFNKLMVNSAASVANIIRHASNRKFAA